MPLAHPPKQDPTNPRFVCLPAGTMLWRIEKRLVQVADGPDGQVRFVPAQEAGQGDVPPTLFSARYPDAENWGGRFDSSAARPDPFCYTALDDLTALAEAVLGDLRFDSPRRYLPLAGVIGRNLSLLETRRPLWLISLTTLEELAAARQDIWLIQSEPAAYSATQEWGEWLRRSVRPAEPATTTDQASLSFDPLAFDPPPFEPLLSESPPFQPLPAGPPAGIIWPARRNPGGRAVVLFESSSYGALVRSPFGTRALDDPDGRNWLNRRLHQVEARIARPLPSAPAVRQSSV